MLPAKTPFQVTNNQAKPAKTIALKLPDEIVRKLSSLPEAGLRVQFCSSQPSENRLFLGEAGNLQFSLTPETQSVDVVRGSHKKGTLYIIGRVQEKMSIKQELVSEKASAIRLQSEQAEKERLARKTLTIEAPSKNIPQRKRSALKASASVTSLTSSRSRLMQKITKSKKTPTTKAASPYPTKPGAKAPSDKGDGISTQSWSPPIDVFNKPPEPRSAKLQLSGSNTLHMDSQDFLAPVMRASSSEPVPSAQHSALGQKTLKLSEELAEKSKEYGIVEKWIDNRLGIFVQLQKDLATASGNQSATDRITNRIALETKHLEADKEYKWKRFELEQLKKSINCMKNELANLE